MICDIPCLVKKSDCLSASPICIVRDVCRDPDTAAHGLSSLHQHNFIEFSCILDGCGTHRIWNESYPVKQGDLYVLNTAVPHGFFSYEGEVPPLICSLYFDPYDLFDNRINEIGGQNYLFGLFAHNNFAVHLSLKSKQLDSIMHTVDSIEEELDSAETGWQDVIRARLTLLLITVRRLAVSSRTPHPYRGNENEQLAAAALQMIGEHFGDPDFSLATAAGLLYKSQSALSRSFHAATGEYFSDYLRTVRLHHAANLTADDFRSNEDIALLCGYRDIPSFYRQFRNAFGMTPGAYRKQKKNSNLNIQEALTMSQTIYTEISDKLQRGKAKDVSALVTQAIEENLPAEDILNEGLVSGMSIIGEKFRQNEVFVPEVLVAARAMNAGLKILKPYLTEAGVEPIGKAIICTVKGDMHDIGKNLVKMMIEGKGIECIDLGVDADPAAIVDAVRENDVQLVCLSALLTTTMLGQRDVIEALREAGLRDKVCVMVGGAPITAEFAKEIGADCYTSDAASAANEAKRLILEFKAE